MSFISVGVCMAEGLLDFFPGSAQGFAIWMVSYRGVARRFSRKKWPECGDAGIVLNPKANLRRK